MDLAFDTPFGVDKIGKLDWIILGTRDADDYNNVVTNPLNGTMQSVLEKGGTVCQS